MVDDAGMPPDVLEDLCLAVVNDVALAEQVWDEIPPVLRILTVLRHRELTDKLWHVIPDSIKCATIVADDDEIDAMVRQVIHDYVFPADAGF
jgi:hypothetical protein